MDAADVLSRRSAEAARDQPQARIRREDRNKLVRGVLAAFALSTGAPALAADVHDLGKVEGKKGDDKKGEKSE